MLRKTILILACGGSLFFASAQPTITNVTTDLGSGNYTVPTLPATTTISVFVTFSEAVTVTGSASLYLDLGIIDPPWNYVGGSGSTVLQFTHTLANGDYTTKLDYQSTTSIYGTIQSVATGTYATLTFPTSGAVGSLTYNRSIAIKDNEAPLVSYVVSSPVAGTYYQCDVISITVDFDEPVIITGTPQLALETGTIDRYINYSSGSGSSGGGITFTYTVQSGDASLDLDYLSSSALVLNGGTILDQSGNAANRTLPAPGATNSLGANCSNVINGIPPSLPTTQASNISFSNLTSTSYTISWSSGNGARRLVVAKQGSPVDSYPVNGTAYTGGTVFGSGTQLGTGNFVVYAGNSSTVTVTGLSPTTVYYFQIFEYEGQCTPLQLYNTTTATNNPTSQTTLANQPSTLGTTPTISNNTTGNSLSVNWTTNGNGTSRIVFAYDASVGSGTPVPVDGRTYTASTVLGSGDYDSAYAGGGKYVKFYVVYNGSGAAPVSIPVSNLIPNTQYKFYVYEYNGANGSENYATSQRNTSVTTSTAANPMFFAGPTSVSSISTITVSQQVVFSFTIYNSSTQATIASIQINQGPLNQVADWTDVISSASISGCIGASVIVSATNILFANTGGCSTFWKPPTNGKDADITIALKSAVGGTSPQTIDGKKLDFLINNSSFIIQSGPTMSPSNLPVTNAVAVDVDATKLKFLQQPPLATWTGAAMSPAVTVEATDNNGNRDLDFVSSCGLTSTGILTSPQSATFVSGVGTYNNIVHSATSNALILSTTNSSGLVNTSSNGFAITQPLVLSPDAITLYPRAANSEKVVMTLSKPSNLTVGNAVSGFSSSSGVIGSATYSAANTVTLTSGANGQWLSGTTFTYTNGTGNLKDVDGIEFGTISSHAVTIETMPPSISNVSIPNSPMKVGSVVTATITVADDDGDDPLIASGGAIDGFSIGSLTNTGTTSKTVTFTVAEGGADVAAGSNIPVSVTLKDGQNNVSAAYTTAIIQGGDAIDANSPKVISINRQSAVNPWSTSNGTSATAVVFRVTFSENIDASSISSADFSIPVTGSLTGAAISSIVAVIGTSVYDVTVNSYSGTGSLGLNYVDNNDVNAIKDLAGNSTITSLANADGDFTGQSYSIVLPQPTAQVPSLSLTNQQNNGVTVQWSDASSPVAQATHYLVVFSCTPTFSINVHDGTYFPDDTDFSDCLQLKNVTFGTNTATFSGLSAGTQYYFAVYPYTSSVNYSNDNIDYNTSSPAAASGFTLPPDPTGLSSTAIGQNTFTANWTSSLSATNYLLDVSLSNAFDSFVTGYNGSTISGTSGVVNGLAPGTTYYYRVRAVNASGVSNNSVSANVLTAPPDPTVPSSSTFTQTSFFASWAATLTATGYKIDISTSSTFSTFVSSDVSVSGTSTTVSGLTAGTTYYYRIRAVNSSGPSGNSPTATALTIPPDPQTANATGFTQTSFIANWNPSASATSYRLDVSTSNSFTPILTGYNDLLVSTTSQSVAGLSAGINYFYRVRAVNSSGTSNNSSSNSTGLTIPPDPVASNASNISVNSFTANWNQATGATGYLLDVSSSSNFSTTVTGYNAKDVSNVQTADVSGLSAGTIYYYRVKAYNSSGTSNASPPIAQITICDPPGALDPTLVQSNAFAANWSSVTGADQYELDVLDNSTNLPVTNYPKLIPSGQNVEIVQGLQSSTVYKYFIRAKNSAGFSAQSSSKLALTLTGSGQVLNPPSVSVNEGQSTISSVQAQTSNGIAPLLLTLKHRSISDSKFVSEPAVTIASPGASKSVSINSSWVDELGMEYYFVIKDAANRSDSSQRFFVYQKINIQNVPVLQGEFSGNWKMFSIPAEITNNRIDEIFSPIIAQFGGYSKDKWKLFHYNSSAGKYEEYQAGLTSIVQGEGYWIIAANALSGIPINSAVTEANQDKPFTYQYQKGWNLIGNPYPFNIDWPTVQNANANAGLNGLHVWESGQYNSKTVLKTWGAAFVFSDNGGTVSYPVTSKTLSGGRLAKSELNTQLDDSSWRLSLSLTLNGLGQTSAIGMDVDANQSKDKFDEIAVPRFVDFLDMTTYHKDFFAPYFSTDIVPTSNRAEWTFALASSQTGNGYLEWDGKEIETAESQLVLVDLLDGVWVDMKSKSSYTFEWKEGRQIKILYSRDGVIDPGISLLGQAYPNPFSSGVQIPLIQGGSDRASQINVYDALGRKVATLNTSFVEPGIHNISWDGKDDQGNVVSSGVLFYRSDSKSNSTKRLVKQ